MRYCQRREINVSYLVVNPIVFWDYMVAYNFRQQVDNASNLITNAVVLRLWRFWQKRTQHILDSSRSIKMLKFTSQLRKITIGLCDWWQWMCKLNAVLKLYWQYCCKQIVPLSFFCEKNWNYVNIAYRLDIERPECLVPKLSRVKEEKWNPPLLGFYDRLNDSK